MLGQGEIFDFKRRAGGATVSDVESVDFEGHDIGEAPVFDLR